MTEIRETLSPSQIAQIVFNKTQNKENQMAETPAPQLYTRKTFDVEGIQVNADNMDAVAAWCGGHVLAHKATESKPAEFFIEVPVKRPLNDRQKQAHVGDWVLKAKTGFKVYTDKAMKGCFQRKPEGADATYLVN